MGQQLPLPERIPVPSPDISKKLDAMGITVSEPEQQEKYVEYTLPLSWKMVDRSNRQDLPHYHIVDSDSMIRVTISGAWKGTYDNELWMSVPTVLEKCEEPESHHKIASETDGINLIGKFAEGFDPLKRPSNRVDKVYLDEDYTPVSSSQH